MRLLADFVGHARRAALLAPGDRVLVACSGGSDSVALLHLVARAAKRLRLGGIAVAHLDHALREDSGDDARFVAELAARLGLPLRSERRRVLVRRGESPEAAARRVRYEFLARAARAERADVVATAHQMDDQAETVLLRMLRGAAIGGLAAIPASRPLTPRSRVRVVRPLLPFRRAQLRAWLARWNETWRDDPTNDSGNVRARLRNDALPALARSAGRDPVPLLARIAEEAALLTAPGRPPGERGRAARPRGGAA